MLPDGKGFGFLDHHTIAEHLREGAMLLGQVQKSLGHNQRETAQLDCS